MTKYLLYRSDDENSYAFFEEGDERQIRLLPANATLVWSVHASSWEEAQIKKHEYLGWEPYRPMGGGEE